MIDHLNLAFDLYQPSLSRTARDAAVAALIASVGLAGYEGTKARACTPASPSPPPAPTPKYCNPKHYTPKSTSRRAMRCSAASPLASSGG